MTLARWMRSGSGELGPEKTYMIPPKEIAAGPVWVKSDVERFAEEIGRQRAPVQSKPAAKAAKRNGGAKRRSRAKRPARK